VWQEFGYTADALPCNTHYLARRGTLELCVLALIASKPRYGYDLVTALERWEPLATTEGTLYPLLRRLQREGKVEASWEESAAGPPRKYYRLTPLGRDLLERMRTDWAELSEAVGETLSTEEAKSHG
jgi:PadR family transcriptional regulator, regulatory protein PadR